MANKNLVSLKDRTTKEQRKIATMGGKKSGEVRRKKRDLRQMLEMVLERKLPERYKKALSHHYSEKELKTLNLMQAMVTGIIDKAIVARDVSAFREVFDRLEGKPLQRVETNDSEGNPDTNIFIGSDLIREKMKGIVDVTPSNDKPKNKIEDII